MATFYGGLQLVDVIPIDVTHTGGSVLTVYTCPPGHFAIVRMQNCAIQGGGSRFQIGVTEIASSNPVYLGNMSNLENTGSGGAYQEVGISEAVLVENEVITIRGTSSFNGYVMLYKKP